MVIRKILRKMLWATNNSVEKDLRLMFCFCKIVCVCVKSFPNLACNIWCFQCTLHSNQQMHSHTHTKTKQARLGTSSRTSSSKDKTSSCHMYPGGRCHFGKRNRARLEAKESKTNQVKSKHIKKKTRYSFLNLGEFRPDGKREKRWQKISGMDQSDECQR